MAEDQQHEFLQAVRKIFSLFLFSEWWVGGHGAAAASWARVAASKIRQGFLHSATKWHGLQENLSHTLKTENQLLQESAQGEFEGRSLFGSAEGIYFKTKVKTEKIWTIWPVFRPPPPLLCDGRQTAHFHEKQLLTGTGSLKKLFYSVLVPSLSRRSVVLCVCLFRKKRENASVQPQTSICLKKWVLQHLWRGLHHVLASHMCSITYSTPSFLSAFHGLIHSHPRKNFAGEWYDIDCFITGQETNADCVLERMADCLSCTYVKILLIHTCV